MSPAALRPWIVGAVLVAFGVIAPALFTEYYLGSIITQALWLGIAASSLIFLAAYGGWVSLGQTGLYGIAGFTMANLVRADGGSPEAWNPWLAVIAAMIVTVAVGLLLGAVSSRSEGIYFLMLTLAFSVIVTLFFEKVTSLSGFGGVNNVDRPDLIGNPVQDPTRLYYVALVCALLVYLLIRYVIRTPFGIAFAGVRDNPTRMRALGFNVALHRTLAFGFGAFVASIAGVLAVWWNSSISPGAIEIDTVIDLLVIAVIGGLYRIEGAWIGAFVYVILDNATRQIDLIGARFNTFIGLVFLAIVVLSPGGLAGIYEQARSYVQRTRGRSIDEAAVGGTGS